MPRRLTKSPNDIRIARRERREKAERDASGDEVPADMDVFRNTLARRIYLFIGNRKQLWRGCPERICRRQRACAAPRSRCSNGPPPLPPDSVRTARVMAQVTRALKALPPPPDKDGEIAEREPGDGRGKKWKSDPGSGV